MGKTTRLVLFGLTSLLLVSTLVFGIYLPYQRAYELVHPARISVPAQPEDLAGYQDVEFQTSDGLTLKGWYAPPQNGAVVIFVHGHASTRTALLDEARLVTAQGYGVLLFDLRNHGQSDGNITTLGDLETLDVLRAVEFVQAQTRPDSPLALVGHSMGSAAVLLAAAQAPQVDCIVTLSAYTSVEDNISDGVRQLTGLPPFPFAPLVVFFGEQQAGIDIHAVRPIDALPKISPRPILFIHGAQDPLILVHNAERLYEAASQPKQLYILPEAGHANFFEAEPEAYPRHLLDFLQSCLLQP